MIPVGSWKANGIVFVAICVVLVIGVKDSIQSIITSKSNYSNPVTTKWDENEEIQIFRKYLRYPTVSLQSDFGPCVEFLKAQATNLGLSVSVHYPVNDRNPVVLMTWKGSRPKLPSILLNSHMDVVPVAEEYWTHSPFEAEIDANGNIFARGAQDMKSVGMQYLAAIRAIKKKGIQQMSRTIHLTYVPDEESGGYVGFGPFVKSDTFKSLNVGFVLDEGYPSESDNLEVFYAEKCAWVVNITAHGHSGHSSVMFEGTAGEKLVFMLNKFIEFRKEEMRKWKVLKHPYANITAINLTILKGGLKVNIVPPDMSSTVNMRLGINADWEEYDRKINGWVEEAGGNITIKINKALRTAPTKVDSSNPYWIAFKKATDYMHLNVTPSVFRAATDSRYVRDINIPALGFSPLMNTPPMLHEHNEYINAETYLKGIKIYQKIIETVSSLN